MTDTTTRRWKSVFGLGALALPVLLFSAWPAGAGGGEPDESAAAERTVVFHYRATIPAAPRPDSRLQLWLPIPQDDGFQQIRELRLENPYPLAYRRDAEYGNRYAYLQVEDGWPEFQLHVSFRVRRREHRGLRGAGPAARASWLDAAGTTRFLRPDRLVPVDGLIAQIAAQQLDSTADPLERARQAFDYVVSTIRYDKSGQGWGRGDALFACDAKRGNCTDFHSLLIGLLRACRIPARFEMGFSLPPEDRAGDIPGYHCWASFYLDGQGWVPVDASEAWKHPERKDYFFGSHDQHRVLFTIGRDIRLEPPPRSGSLNYFIYPHAEVDGRPIEVESRFSFRDVDPAGLPETGR